jgi:hypothetical protein
LVELSDELDKGSLRGHPAPERSCCADPRDKHRAEMDEPRRIRIKMRGDPEGHAPREATMALLTA